VLEVAAPSVADPGGPHADVEDRLGMTPRTLRRRLAGESTSWRAVTNDLKFARAARIAEGHPSVQEVAEEVGYFDPAHFVRFFRRRAGVLPGAYRERIEFARELARRSPR
jgi:AraC-like DNA-binding protein